MEPKDYKNYQTADFVLDDDFLQWVKHADADSDTFWQAFLHAHPQQKQAVDEAREFILAAGEATTPFTAAEIALLRQQVQAIPARQPLPACRQLSLRGAPEGGIGQQPAWPGCYWLQHSSIAGITR